MDLEYVSHCLGVKTLAGAVDVLRDGGPRNARHHGGRSHFPQGNDDRFGTGLSFRRSGFHFGHLCDAPGEIPSDRDEMTRILREERSYVGEGGIDVAAIMNAMPAMPYSIELPNLKKVAEYGYKEHAQRCLKTARTYCAGRVTGRKG